MSPRPAPKGVPSSGAVSLRQILKSIVFGFGAGEWISTARRRAIQINTFLGGVFLGGLIALFVRRLPEGALDATGVGVIAAIALVITIMYVVHDTIMVKELVEKRQVQSDIDLARQIQLRLLPSQLPALDDYSIDVYHEAARSVGGDAYDVLRLDDDHVFLTVADVSGKGAAAAVLMSGVLARMRALARTGMPLNELTARLSAALDQETEPFHYAAVSIVVLEISTGVMRYVNAGNQPPMVIRTDGSRLDLKAGGIPVGMMPDVKYTSGQAFLGHGDCLVLTTDGVLDADDTGASLLTEDELAEFVKEDRGSLDGVRREVRRRSPEGQFDDITVLAVRRDA